jgi:tetratricopeptide (TPR) repeat protein
VQLIETATGFHVFSRSFDRKLRDYLGIQREITQLTVANLRVALPSDDTGTFEITSSDPDVDAYIMYRRGKTALDQPATEETLGEAISYFEKALEIDTGYSAAHAGICIAHVTHHETMNDSASIDLAQRACSEALISNPNLGVVYTALGRLHWSTGKTTEARIAYQRALAVNEQDVSAMSGLAAVLEREQQTDEAELLLKKAIALQPGNWQTINWLGSVYFVNGRYLEAAHAFRQLVFLDSANWRGHGNLGSALMMAGDFKGSLDATNASLSIERHAYYLSNLGIIYYYLGEYDEAVKIHREAAQENSDSSSVWLNLGDALRFSSQPDEAIEAYRQAMDIAAKLLAVNPANPENLYVQSWATAAIGDSSESRILIDRALALAPNDPYVHYYDGLLKNNAGQAAAAIDALQLAVEMGYPPKMLAADPLLSDLDGHSRFKAIVGEI